MILILLVSLFTDFFLFSAFFSWLTNLLAYKTLCNGVSKQSQFHERTVKMFGISSFNLGTVHPHYGDSRLIISTSSQCCQARFGSNPSFGGFNTAFNNWSTGFFCSVWSKRNGSSGQFWLSRWFQYNQQQFNKLFDWWKLRRNRGWFYK